MRQKIGRTNDFAQAGDRYRAFEPYERDELIMNLVDALKGCPRDIQERMVGHFTQADAEYGRWVAEGIGLASGGNGVQGHVAARSGAAASPTAD